MSGSGHLLHGYTYHIYNRGTNGESIFREERNYRHFLKLNSIHIRPVADTYAYCLLNNHFHFLIRVKSIDELEATAGSQLDPVSETGPS